MLKRLLGSLLSGSREATRETPSVCVSDLQRMSPIVAASALGGDDLIDGMQFVATMQLRTPLRVLRRHGEVHRGSAALPAIAQEQWEGIWVPRVKTWRELGIDTQAHAPLEVASEFGPVAVERYLPFLLAVRSIVEADGSVAERRDRLQDELRNPQWATFCKKLGGNAAVVERFFPPFIQSIVGLSTQAQDGLRSATLCSPAAIDAATDAQLREIRGIGPAKLVSVRAACAVAIDRHSEFVEVVSR